MKTITEIRNNMFDYHRKYYSYVFDEWKWWSYRKWKIYLYMITTPVLAYPCIRFGITPNPITVVYILLGVMGGIFLAIPVKWFILAALLIFWLRPIVDCTDGVVARETGRTSMTGDLLDNYGSLAGWVPLWAGMGLYIADKFGDMRLLVAGISAEHIFYYLTPVIPVLIAINLMTSAKNKLLDDYIAKTVRDSLKKDSASGIASGLKTPEPSPMFLKLRKIFNFFNKVFEHNAGFLDLILLILFIELFIPYFISWVVFLVFLAWQIIYFAASFYLEQIHKEEPTS
jgi:hypothetical protein